MGPWGWIWILIWIGALLLMVWMIVRAPAERSTSGDALAILGVRFARGEISQEEFDRAKDALSSDHQESIR